MKTIATILIMGFATATFANEGEVDVDATYFHPAASHYIHGDSTSASNLVAKGISLFPEDGKLLRLKELLEQQQKQEQQQNQDQQDQDQQQEEQDQQQEKNQDQQQQDQQPESQSAEQMSVDEAEQLLDAMKQEEQNKRNQLKVIIGNPVNVDKDW